MDRIEKSIALNVPVERVWSALTDHHEYGQWFQVRIDGPFVVGQVSLGQITTPGYEHYRWHATVQKMEPMRLFSFTWPHPADPDMADYSNEPVTLVEFRLEPTETGTRLTVVESGFDAVPAARRALAMRENEGGWEIQMSRIRAHVGP